MGQVCAWCEDEIGASSLGRVSHGMCRPCFDARIAALPAIRHVLEPDRARNPKQPRQVFEATPLALA